MSSKKSNHLRLGNLKSFLNSVHWLLRNGVVMFGEIGLLMLFGVHLIVLFLAECGVMRGKLL